MNVHKTVSMADQVFDRLEMDILSGIYSRGEIISELKLSADLGVSRTPIREALQRLEQEHLVEDTGNGIAVVGISREDMLDMYEIRLRLEGIAASRAAKNISGEALREMGEILDLQEFNLNKQEEAKEDRSDKTRDLDSRFHDLLFRSSGSRILENTLQDMHKKIAKFRKASFAKSDRARISLQEHRAIYEALKIHDEKKAEEAMVSHIIHARDSICGLKEGKK